MSETTTAQVTSRPEWLVMLALFALPLLAGVTVAAMAGQVWGLVAFVAAAVPLAFGAARSPRTK